MKFVILADIHLGPQAYFKGVLRKVNDNAMILIKNFVEEINKNVKPDFVVILGDLIEDEEEVKDKERIKNIIALLSKLTCPVYYSAGNHDLMKISENDLKELFKQESLYYSFDFGDLHFVNLFARRIEKGNVQILPEQLTWLKNDLGKTSKKCVVFLHYSLADQDLKGNPWFEGAPELCLVRNRAEVREIFEKSGRVIAVFNSHLHWNKIHFHNSVPYFTIQSLVENQDDKGIASEAYAIVEINKKRVNVLVKGKYPQDYKVELK